MALLAAASCDNSPAGEIDISFQSDDTQLVAAVEDVNKSLSERLSLVEAALSSGLADSQTALALLQKAVESLRGSLEEKLAALLEAVQNQSASLETKMALIEAALRSGFADEAAQQALLEKTIASLGGSLEQKLAALETVMKNQGTALDSKLGLVDAAVKAGLADNAAAQDLLKEAIESLGGTLETRIAAIDSALVSRQTPLTAKLSLIQTALTEGFSSDAKALQQLQTAVTSLKGLEKGTDQTIDDIIAALGSFDSTTTSFAEALSKIQKAVSGLSNDNEILTAIQQTLISYLPKTINGHEYVEMGDGLKWATCNVGATTPEEYGDFFAWGETGIKDEYGFENYNYITDKQYTKYNHSDKKTKLELTDDAARANWGGTWRMPTDAELDWLRNNCTWKWTSNYGGIGAIGVIVTSLVPGYVGNQIFFPAAGFQTYGTQIDVGSKGNYWSSCLNPVSTEAITEQAYFLHFYGHEIASATRFSGKSVRPVSD